MWVDKLIFFNLIKCSLPCYGPTYAHLEHFASQSTYARCKPAHGLESKTAKYFTCKVPERHNNNSPSVDVSAELPTDTHAGERQVIYRRFWSLTVHSCVNKYTLL